MVERDFFVFCTSLKRPELRAIGELSWVRHLAEGEVLYRPGDPGNALFIVNRGILEVQAEHSESDSHSIILMRGEVIGDVEAFSGVPRLRLVEAREAASVQCFPRANFQELLRQVPSFFQYLCEQMAYRVVQANERAKHHGYNAPLSGRISHFDLTTVHQTISHSRQTGELSIKDEHAQIVGAFYFEAGRPSAGRFQHLTGEEAYWQLFLTENLTGTFSFSVGERALTSAIESQRILRSAEDMLIAALQYRDEYDALSKESLPASTKLRAVGTEFEWNGSAPVELEPVATQIWESVSRKPASAKELYRKCSVCELKIALVVRELVATNKLKPFDAAAELRAQPAEFA